MGQILHGSAKTTHAVRAAIQRSKASIQELDVLPAIMSVAAAANKIRNAAEISCLIGSGPSTPTPAPRPMPLSKTMGRERPDAVGCSLSRMR